MADDPSENPLPPEAILSEESIAAGVAALEQIHGRHLADMTPDEQADARDHWRSQVEQVLQAVHDVNVGPAAPGAGRAVISFTDAGDDRIDVSVAFQPDLEDMGDGQVAGTPAQVLALSALEALGDEDEDSAGEEVVALARRRASDKASRVVFGRSEEELSPEQRLAGVTTSAVPGSGPADDGQAGAPEGLILLLFTILTLAALAFVL